ncbi:VOC family protein [Saccharopolyspora taberi]|uniref:VOC family protein n=1 Tax=Saccharopolyspora taberi TaxID=60895 RepID=A0ABN3VFT7_9PSEU
MFSTTRPGSPNWIDLGTPDTDAAAEFYREVFGWQVRSAGPGAGGYGFFLLDGKMVGAVGPLTEEGATSSWTVHFHTSDADATAKAVEQAGGSVRMAPDDVFDQGRLAAFTDPTGAEFAVWQPGAHRGLEVVGAENSLLWTELYTPDAAKAGDFYRAVFGWNVQDAPIPGVSYGIVSAAGAGPDDGHGGIMQLPEENLAAGSGPEWHPYIAVADVDATLATAAGSGATVLIPADSAPGVGRLAMFLDPFGAQVAVITPDPS